MSPPDFGFVTPAVDVLCDEIAQHASDKHIRRKVLAAMNARKVNRSCRSVRDQLRQDSGIFVGYYTGNRPGGGCVLRGKRCSALEEVSAAGPLIWTFPPERILHEFDRDQAIQGRFAGEPAGFAPVLVVGRKAYQVHASGRSGETGDARV